MNPVTHYLLIDNERKGPFAMSQLQSMWHAGTITSETLHYMDGYTDWCPLEYIREDLDPPQPLRQSPTYSASKPVVIAKSRGIYIILGLFFLGLLGAHNFYAGRYWPGFFQLIITLLTGWLYLPLAIVAIWVIFELLLVTKDGNGQPMS